MQKLLEDIGNFTLHVFEQVGVIAILFAQTLRQLPKNQRRLMFNQMAHLGVNSLPIVSMTLLFAGMVMTLQIVDILLRYGAQSTLGGVMSVAMGRELGPILTGVVMAGRVGAAMTAEIGTMKVTEQIDALRCMAVNPIAYLVVPRFIACVIMAGDDEIRRDIDYIHFYLQLYLIRFIILRRIMIRLRDVTVAYGDKVILDNINLDIHQGETLAVLGASGSGKSTILRLIIGLQKPTKGHVFFQDTDITAYDEDQLMEVRRHMGMVFQYSALFDSMTVGENVAFGLRQHTHDDAATRQRIVKEKLHLVGLDGIEDMMPNNLSGGMKKRVSLARAIALDPQVILYDEPTAGLDPLRCMDINRLVVNMQKQLHATSVIVTHDMDSAFFVADRLAYLQDGRFRLIADKKSFAQTDDEDVQRFIHGGRLPEERGDSL